MNEPAEEKSLAGQIHHLANLMETLQSKERQLTSLEEEIEELRNSIDEFLEQIYGELPERLRGAVLRAIQQAMPEATVASATPESAEPSQPPQTTRKRGRKPARSDSEKPARKEPFSPMRAAARMVAEAAQAIDLPDLDYANGSPSTFEEGMELLLGTQWELQIVVFRHQEYRANDPIIREWLQTTVPRVVDIFVESWRGNRPNDKHLVAAANKVQPTRQEYVRRLADAMRPKEEHERLGLPDPEAHERMLRDHDPRLED